MKDFIKLKKPTIESCPKHYCFDFDNITKPDATIANPTRTNSNANCLSVTLTETLIVFLSRQILFVIKAKLVNRWFSLSNFQIN